MLHVERLVCHRELRCFHDGGGRGGGGGAPEWGREDVGFFRRACEYVERMGWEGTVALPEFQRVKRYLRGIGEEGGGGIEGGEGVRGGVCEDENGGI